MSRGPIACRPRADDDQNKESAHAGSRQLVPDSDCRHVRPRVCRLLGTRLVYGQPERAPALRLPCRHHAREPRLRIHDLKPRYSGVLRACFEQRPFTERPPGHVPFVNVEMDGDRHPHGSDDLRRLADTLTAHADEIRKLADRLDGLANAFDATQRGAPAAANPEKSRGG
ncbi:DUF6907 domain-containing protein [Streptomyces antibioticus]|uniref:DUF6907 domain-containing protein n=1 Tax=Streptomyces antibioticus TaxID=1890 RepID=UPI003D704312